MLKNIHKTIYDKHRKSYDMVTTGQTIIMWERQQGNVYKGMTQTKLILQKAFLYLHFHESATF